MKTRLLGVLATATVLSSSALALAEPAPDKFIGDFGKPPPAEMIGDTGESSPPGVIGDIGKPASITQKNLSLPPGVYEGPSGALIQVTQSLSQDGAASDLAAKGIIIIQNMPVDGRYIGPGGASLLVQHGIIIVQNKPAPR